MGIFDVNDLTNKIDVGSQPGTMWSLSSQKPGHGLAQLRDPDQKKLWQSDGLLPHLVNIQFSRRTALTHVSIFMDFKQDDSYTPNKVRILAGTHYHDLVEVRTREFKEPSGWKHFILDNFEDGNESEPDQDGKGEESDCSSDSNQSSSSVILSNKRKHSRNADHHQDGAPLNGSLNYLPCGVSKRHSPIYAFLVQICILSNHAAGKDTHIRGIRIFGPPTKLSRERAKRELRKAREAKSSSNGKGVKTVGSDQQREEQRRKKKALESVYRWAATPTTATTTTTTVEGESEEGATNLDESGLEIPTSRRLNLLSSLR